MLCDAREMHTAARWAATIIPTRVYQPEHALLFLDVPGDRLVLSADDAIGYRGATVEVAEPAGGLKVGVIADTFLRATAGMVGDVALDVAKDRLHLRCGPAKVSLGISTLQRPEPVDLGDVIVEVTVDGEVLSDAFGVVARAASNNPAFATSQVQVVTGAGGMSLLATDNYAAHRWDLCDEPLPEGRGLIARARAQQITMAGDVRVALCERGLTATTDTHELSILGQHADRTPDVAGLLDRFKSVRYVAVDPAEAVAALQTVRACAQGLGSGGFSVSLDPTGGLRVFATHDENAAEVTVECETVGGDPGDPVVINGEYLLQMLRACPGEVAEVAFTDMATRVRSGPFTGVVGNRQTGSAQ